MFFIAGLNKNSFLSKIRKKKAQFILFYLAQRASIYSAQIVEELNLWQHLWSRWRYVT